MSTITVVLLAAFASTYVVGFFYCVSFEKKLRYIFHKEDISIHPAPSTVSNTFAQFLGMLVVPVVLGGLFVFRRDTQERWNIELSLVKASLQTRMEESRLTWPNAIRAQDAYAKTFLPK